MTKRPELGELTAGQDVIVVRSPNDSRRIPAKIVKANRVWIELGQTDDMPMLMTWRMRRDTQDEGTQYTWSNARFVTLEQNAWEETRAWGASVLRENGINLERDSPWWNREAELADLITGGKKA